jgi:hypothetical protein
MQGLAYVVQGAPLGSGSGGKVSFDDFLLRES